MSDTAKTPIDRAKYDIHEDVDGKFTTRTLTPRLRRLVNGYVRGGMAQAARESGYSNQTVKKHVTSNPLVRRAIGEMVDQAAMLSGVTLERVLQEYARIAFADIGGLYDVLALHGDPDAALAAFADLPADQTAAISEIVANRKTRRTDDGEEIIDGSFRLKLYDKKSALQDLGRMLSLFNDKLTIEDKTGFGDRLERAIRKIEGLDG